MIFQLQSEKHLINICKQLENAAPKEEKRIKKDRKNNTKLSSTRERMKKQL